MLAYRCELGTWPQLQPTCCLVGWHQRTCGASCTLCSSDSMLVSGHLHLAAAVHGRRLSGCQKPRPYHTICTGFLITQYKCAHHWRIPIPSQLHAVPNVACNTCACAPCRLPALQRPPAAQPGCGRHIRCGPTLCYVLRLARTGEPPKLNSKSPPRGGALQGSTGAGPHPRTHPAVTLTGTRLHRLHPCLPPLVTWVQGSCGVARQVRSMCHGSSCRNGIIQYCLW
jgi:hypothetical protein